MWLELLILLASLLAFFGYKIKQKQSTYWQSKGVKCPPAQFPFGNNPDIGQNAIMPVENVNIAAQRQYNLMKGEKFYGTYQLMTPILVLTDPDLIKQVLVKDFNHFVDRVGSVFTKMFAGSTRADEIWRKGMPASSGETWKNTRSTFSPIFTSGKMRAMMHLIEQVNNKLISSFDTEAKTGSEIELKEKFGKFSMDTIALCAFGVDAQSFTNPKSTFASNAKRIFRRDLSDLIKLALAVAIPGGKIILKLFQIAVMKGKETDFFDEVLQVTLRERRRSNVRQNDLIDMMLDAMKEDGKQMEKEDLEELEGDTKLDHKADKNSLDDITIIATAIMLLIAGYDSTAQTLAYAIYEMAMNPEIQKRLQDEIDDTFEDSNGKLLDYNKIQSMEYLDMVFQETLRRYPVAGTLHRASTADYTIPGTNIKISKGQEVSINAAGIHADPKYYPEPEKFNPEHFSKEAKAARHPYAFLGFGQGPRNCIGMRFATLEAKTALISLFSKYSVVKSERTVEKVTLDPASTLGASKDILYVRLVARK